MRAYKLRTYFLTLTLVHVAVCECKRPLTVTLATPPVAIVHAFSIRKHEALVTVSGRSKVRQAIFPNPYSGARITFLWYYSR